MAEIVGVILLVISIDDILLVMIVEDIILVMIVDDILMIEIIEDIILVEIVDDILLLEIVDEPPSVEFFNGDFPPLDTTVHSCRTDTAQNVVTLEEI